jgi:hypothetical protein
LLEIAVENEPSAAETGVDPETIVKVCFAYTSALRRGLIFDLCFRSSFIPHLLRSTRCWKSTFHSPLTLKTGRL